MLINKNRKPKADTQNSACIALIYIFKKGNLHIFAICDRENTNKESV